MRDETSLMLKDSVLTGNTAPPNHSSGGAVFATNNARILAINTTFADNRAQTGGAVSLGHADDNANDDASYTSADFISCRFLNNSAHKRGGALFTTGSGCLTVASSQFKGNKAWSGAVLHSTLLDVFNMTDCLVEGNTATGLGSIFIQDAMLTDFQNCAFRGNVGHAQGGALLLMAQSQIGPCTILDCLFHNNRWASALLG